eukprot:jgi/Botrbrau1/18355/Bobra.0179s0080.1
MWSFHGVPQIELQGTSFAGPVFAWLREDAGKRKGKKEEKRGACAVPVGISSLISSKVMRVAYTAGGNHVLSYTTYR